MRYRVSFAAADLGFDPRAIGQEVQYPAWAGDGPVTLIVDHESTGWSQTLFCQNRDEAVGFLKKFGYRVRLPPEPTVA
jgi:hypothetical protein